MLNLISDLLTVVGSLVAIATLMIWFFIKKIDSVLPRLLGVFLFANN